MASPTDIYETLAKMRRRVREIDMLIASIEQGRIPAHVAVLPGRSTPRTIRICKPISRGVER